MLNDKLTAEDIQLLESTRQRVAIKFVYYEVLTAAVADGTAAYAGDLYSEVKRRLYPIYPYLSQPSESYNYTGPSSVAKFYKERGWITIEDRYHNYVDGGKQSAYNEVQELDGICMNKFLELLNKVDPRCQPQEEEEPITIDATNYKIGVNGNLKPPVTEEVEQQEGPTQPDLLRRVIAKVDQLLNKAAAFLTGF